jgi:hypothetical protein
LTTSVDEKSRQLVDAANEKRRQLADAAGKFAETGRDYVRTSPATSVLVALGAGYLLSKIFGNKR